MIATVRLNDSLIKQLDMLTNRLHKRKSDVIRDAIELYANSIDKQRETKIKNAVLKTRGTDKTEMDIFESIIDDGL